MTTHILESAVGDEFITITKTELLNQGAEPLKTFPEYLFLDDLENNQRIIYQSKGKVEGAPSEDYCIRHRILIPK